MSKRILFVLMILCFSPLAFGQAIGSFSGTITDKSGSTIAGAAVTVTSQGTGATRDAKTDDSGHYIVNLLPVGVYTIHVQFQGFQSAEAKDLKLQIDESRELNFSLNPASVSSSVEVVADAVAVTTTDPTLGQVINSQQVAQLPLNGRDFVQLATLTPGTVQETNPTSFFNGGPSSEVSARGSFSLSVGGSRANSTDWLLDGNDNNELTAGGIAILSSIDAIQEFKVLTYNYSAEFGTRAGPTVLVTTKSGSNSLHGSLYEFLRNTSLDAKSFFATSPEKFNLNQYGGSLGGPIRKNKTFFFFDGEQKSQRHGTTFAGLVPTDAMRSGDFSNDAYGRPVPVGTLAFDNNGNSAIINPNMGPITGGGASTNGSVFPNIYFQCDANGLPMPVAGDGSQAQGQNCNKIPGANPLNAASLPNGLLNPIGQKLLALYPEPNSITPSPPAIPRLPASATIRRSPMSPVARRASRTLLPNRRSPATRASRTTDATSRFPKLTSSRPPRSTRFLAVIIVFSTTSRPRGPGAAWPHNSAFQALTWGARTAVPVRATSSAAASPPPS